MKYEQNSKDTLAQFILGHIINEISKISQNIIGSSKIILYSVPNAVNFYKKLFFNEFGNMWQGDEAPYLDGCVPLFFNLN